MTGFTSKDKTKALAIVRIFETGTADGHYAAVAVLNDGAGVSYGINQFTHRSGALLAVVERYLTNGGQVARSVIERRLPVLEKATAFNIRWLAADAPFKKALKAAAITSEMKDAQTQIAFERYLQPAIDECERLGFTTPLALAVIYDSITHGSWEKIRDRIGEAALSRNDEAKPRSLIYEKAWVTEYVRRRDAWLSSIPRLAVTRYRTRFFLNQIAIGNWDLKLPLRVHGVRLNDDGIADRRNPVATAPGSDNISAVGPNSHTTNASDEPQQTHQESAETPQAQPPGFLDEVEERVNAAAAKYDQVERVVIAVADRTDAAKSLWATFLGTIWQTLWAVLGLFAGLPREVWLVVAIIAALLTLLYLYRQIALGKIREARES